MKLKQIIMNDEEPQACCIPNYKKLINQGCIFPHPVGIVISKLANIGKNCVIYQNVTIGSKNFYECENSSQYPKIGNNVVIYAGAVIVGNVTIGDGCTIAANTVVTRDIPPPHTGMWRPC